MATYKLLKKLYKDVKHKNDQKLWGKSRSYLWIIYDFMTPDPSLELNNLTQFEKHKGKDR